MLIARQSRRRVTASGNVRYDKNVTFIPEQWREGFRLYADIAPARSASREIELKERCVRRKLEVTFPYKARRPECVCASLVRAREYTCMRAFINIKRARVAYRFIQNWPYQATSIQLCRSFPRSHAISQLGAAAQPSWLFPSRTFPRTSSSLSEVRASRALA